MAFYSRLIHFGVFFGSCVNNNGFVYCSEEDSVEVNVQFGIFSARRHLRQSGSFSFDKDKWRSEFPDGLFSNRISCGFIWYLFHRACRRHLALCKPTPDALFWLYLWAIVTMTMPIVSMTIRRIWELRQWLLLFRLIINVKKSILEEMDNQCLFAWTHSEIDDINHFARVAICLSHRHSSQVKSGHE